MTDATTPDGTTPDRTTPDADRTGPGVEAAAPSRRGGSITLSRSPLDYSALVLVTAAALLLLAGLIYAFAVADTREVDGSERFRLLAQASSPFVAALALAAIVLIVIERRRGGSASTSQVAATAVLGAGSVVSLVALLLAVNGMVVDLTSAVGATFKLSNVIGRFATVTLTAFALVLSATTPARPVVAAADRPVHS